jgi:pimeloyl-ACP methyl ester carboxylesterase
MMPLNRRTLFAASVGAALTRPAAAATAAAATTAPASKPPFVLVHGTWLGGWIWADVAARLRAAGHVVHTPTLTGVGERAHLASPQVGLETHIADIVGVIDAEELSDVILIGHSFSGIAITGAADRRRDRIRHLSFFDALIPGGDRMSGVETDAQGQEVASFTKRRAGFVDGYLMDFWRDYPIAMLIGEDWPALQAKLRRRITPHPSRGWTDRLELNNGGWEGLPRSCIRCPGQTFAPSSEKMWGPSRGPGWTNIDLPCGRMGMMTDPNLVADTFLSLV